jgi:peptidoglycan/LPS O-acetylase OafA/YrhL
LKSASTASARNFGLDIVRSMAISLVLAAHSLLFFFPFYFESLREFFGIFGMFGVEIFFVLSGFLIGQLIVKEVLRPPSARGLAHFWVRRWFRTLPPYFLVLGLRRLVGYPLHWKMFVFLQNFDPAVAASFPISWSLAIEEWFYLLTPLILLIAAFAVRTWSPKAFFLVCSAIGVAALAGRVAYVVVANPSWDPGVRQHIFLRMDSLMIGVLLGGLRAYRRDSYDRLAKHRRLLALLGTAGIAAAAVWLFVAIERFSLNDSFLMRTVYFDWFSLSVALLMVGLESSTAVNTRWAMRKWAGAVRFVSLSSYSLYLIHLSAFAPFQILNAQTRTPSFARLWALGALGTSLVLGGAMYRWFEKPVLRLRDRLTGPVTIERPSPLL